MVTGYFLALIISVLSAVDSAPFGSVSSNVKSDLVLVSRNNNGIGGGNPGPGLSRISTRPQVPAGESCGLIRSKEGVRI